MGRDEQFRQWAIAVWEKMLGDNRYIDVSTGHSTELDPDDDEHKRYIDILARAGYALACHVASHVSETAGALMGADMATPQEIVNEMPDLPALPEETTE